MSKKQPANLEKLVDEMFGLSIATGYVELSSDKFVKALRTVAQATIKATKVTNTKGNPDTVWASGFNSSNRERDELEKEWLND